MTCELRPLTPHDLDLICRQRNDMFRSMDMSEDLIVRMDPAFRGWLQDRLSDGTYFGFIADQDGRPVGGIGLMEIEFPPHPAHPETSRRGRILNLYVEPAARGQGIARHLVQASEAEFKKRGLTYAVLHATDMSRPLYEKDGWRGTAEMEKVLTPD
ncbi:GNAT family N-acetyltransferase [Roseibium sp. MMSF_3412]|uniref:GNAT family N-acetyltransferase n=1 Tax=Roseibium sp. MMSF_3412 TaxID=3046712 RepID=UPI00273F7161|nr:GNAT family N-acetyltransferase [Roseibium sp. MMSF_3412]